MTRKAHIKLKRVYEQPGKSDGKRVLVDRVWPRGISKDKAALDEWVKDVAPSTELRKWFGHSAERWQQFRERYEAEIAGNEEAFGRLVELCRKGDVTLVYSARDEAHNNAVVLKEVLKREL